MFGFDERFAMFDITPVENQFILELLPDAKGDYVKVFLYGLMRCYHPEKDMNLDRMSHELGLTQDEIMSAYRYWERRGAVRRTSDKPPVWQYVNLKQRSLDSGDSGFDLDYQDFANELYEAFEKKRRLHGSELKICFEWREELGLPTEVILMLLNHMAGVKGKNFSLTEADKIAAHMAQEDIRTCEKAEAYFSRDKKACDGTRKILKLLGKNYMPSDAQVAMYRKWTDEWQFTHEAIEKATELTAKGDPSMGYLDGILKSMRNETRGKGRVEKAAVQASERRTEELRRVLNTLGRGEINQQTLLLYDEMRALYPLPVILTAAHECCLTGKGPEDVLKLLQAWKDRKLDSEQEVNDYVQTFHEQTALIRELRKTWGLDENRIAKTDRSLINKWKNELGFGKEMILAGAVYASEARAPMTYLDKILTRYAKEGIGTPEAAAADHSIARAAAGTAAAKKKTVIAQQYEQRDYSDEEERIKEERDRMMEEFLRKNGGESHA